MHSSTAAHRYRPTAAFGSVSALALAAFCYGTTESLPVGLLQLMAEDLHTSLSAVGLLVTGYGLTIAVVSVPLTRATVHFPRRLALSGLLTVFILSTWLSVATDTYWVLLGARVATALSQAVFWPVAVVTAASLFAPRIRGRAAAAVFVGGSLAVLLGVPAGTWLGQHTDWRTSFLALSALGTSALIMIAVLLPRSDSNRQHVSTPENPNARMYWLLVLATALVVGGAFTMYTYTTAFLIDVTGFSSQAISPLLLLRGLADIGGLISAGAVVDRHPRVTMIAAMVFLFVGLLGLYFFGTNKIAVTGFVALTGCVFPALVLAVQKLVLDIAPCNVDVASAGTSAAFNAGIGGGALIGGMLLPTLGIRSTALVGGLLTGVALIVVLAEPLIASSTPKDRAR